MSKITWDVGCVLMRQWRWWWRRQRFMHDGILALSLLFRRMHNKKGCSNKKPQSDSGKFPRSSKHVKHLRIVCFGNTNSTTAESTQLQSTKFCYILIYLYIQQRKIWLFIFIEPKRARWRWLARQKKLTKQFVIERLFNIDCICVWVRFFCMFVRFVSSTMIETC